MTNLIALSSNQTAWLITLGAGLVVLLVVLALLETLRRTVLKVDETVWDAWEAGKRVEHNTVMIYLLKRTRERGSELVEELGNHR
jgi:ABC-type protease/lipase transport system fused ATPase/permease subunit